MKIIVGKQAGFCFGVKRATNMAFDAAKDSGETMSLGPVIHSPQVVERLESMGVKVAETLDGISSGKVIIRSHGVSSGELDQAKGKGLEVIDATCPFVKKAQTHVENLSRDGYTVVVVGDYDHPEVQGIVSYAKGAVHVAGSAEEAEKLPRMKKVGIVAQTTQSMSTLQEVVSVCLPKVYELKLFNTICDATSVRQKEAREIASQVDCMIIVGGYKSGNTRRLAEICAEILESTHHIETASELIPEWFENAESVGITAGASTPKWVIDEVIERISSIETNNKI